MCNRTTGEYGDTHCCLDCVKTASQSDNSLSRSIFTRETGPFCRPVRRTTLTSVSPLFDCRLPKCTLQKSAWHTYSSAVVSECPFSNGCIRHHHFAVSLFAGPIEGNKLSGTHTIPRWWKTKRKKSDIGAMLRYRNAVVVKDFFLLKLCLSVFLRFLTKNWWDWKKKKK